MYNMEKIAPATYLIPKHEGMKVPGLLIAPESFFEDVSMEKPLKQLCNVAYLPGIVGHSIAMPDIHWGYGFPIGGVAAMDLETGVISPGGVGYDINCGIRIAFVPELFSKFSESTKQKLLSRIFELVPSGVGHGYKEGKLHDSDYQQIAKNGAKWAVEHGYGFAEDLLHIESHGVIEGGSEKEVSKEAKDRGGLQLGSIGSGNHFVEIGAVEEIFSEEIASAWGISKGQTYILIHSGSRGFGHQVCQDFLHQFVQKGYDKNLPDRQLVAAPILSDDGQSYLRAMGAAANFAFCNRQKILHQVRRAFQDVCGISGHSIRLLYDVCHNIAKIEEHPYQGKNIKVCVHRKGATRAFGPGHKELAADFQKTGQPVLVPGDMGRASFLLAGKGNPMTWCSCCHGAGRAKSRVECMKHWQGRDAVAHMKKQGVTVLANSTRTIAEEMPDAYKDVSLVVQATKDAGLAGIVAKVHPSLVIKG